MLNQSIKKFMEERGIKQSFLKEQLGMKASTVNALLNGDRKISAEEYFKICNALKVPLDYFKSDLTDDNTK
ncbi:MAG: helix-turn-helix domain-containing protein [Oscillospiraceae bacterium]|nr:helix-turn-helix domain-containing protein [Oscillospiraceae bacterium]